MGSLRGFYHINNSITKLSVNISTKGVGKALMKLGDQIEYDNPKTNNHRQPDSDQDSCGRQAIDKSTGVPNIFVNTVTDSSNMSTGLQGNRR